MRLRTASLDGDRRAAKAMKIADDYDRTISVILIGNNIVNIAASSIATVAATKWFGVSGPAVATVAMTILVLTFGEVLPKSFAKENADKLVLTFASPLSFAIKLFTPAAMLFVKLQTVMLKLTGSEDSPQVTEDELRTIIETSEEEGVIDEQRSELMRSALQFDDTTVQEVLTPRVDLVAIDIDDDPERIRETILRERFSRLPVYRNDIDNIIGILQTRDYLEALLAHSDVSLEEMLTKPLYAHKTQPIASLLSQFKRERRHMAVVVDDYGGTMGIVSMEDLLEELVGEIYDEDEVEEVDIVALSEGEWKISGDYPIEDALKKLGYLERGFESNYSSVGGWAFEMLGHIPEVGETFEYNGVSVRIEEMDDQRVEWVVASYKAKAEEE